MKLITSLCALRHVEPFERGRQVFGERSVIVLVNSHARVGGLHVAPEVEGGPPGRSGYEIHCQLVAILKGCADRSRQMAG